MEGLISFLKDDFMGREAPRDERRQKKIMDGNSGWKERNERI